MCKIFALAALLTACAGCGGGKNSGSPTAPSAGGSALAAGSWTGRFTRPGGATIELRWEATTTREGNIDQLGGPLTLTNSGKSLAAEAHGLPGGNDDSGYKIHFYFQSKSGANSAFPTCSVNGNPPNEDPSFPRPYNTFSIQNFTLSFAGCGDFISPEFGSLTEIGTITLNK